MLKRLFPALALILTTALFTQAFLTPTVVAAPDDDDEPATGGLDMQAMMEAMQLAQPGPEHEQLMATAGTWEQRMTIHMPPMEGMPQMPAMTSTADATLTPVLGGRFLMSESGGVMMGMPVEQLSFIGFDRRTEEYITVGLDTMGTYFVTGRGPRGEDGVVRMHGVDEDPMGRQVYTFEVEHISEDEQRISVLFTEMGGMTFEEPFEMVRIESTRKSDD